MYITFHFILYNVLFFQLYLFKIEFVNIDNIFFSFINSLNSALSNIGVMYSATEYSDRKTRALSTTGGATLGSITLPAGIYLASITLYIASLTTSTLSVRFGWTITNTESIFSKAGNTDKEFITEHIIGGHQSGVTVSGFGYIKLSAQTTLYVRAGANSGYNTGAFDIKAIKIK